MKLELVTPQFPIDLESDPQVPDLPLSAGLDYAFLNEGFKDATIYDTRKLLVVPSFLLAGYHRLHTPRLSHYENHSVLHHPALYSPTIVDSAEGDLMGVIEGRPTEDIIMPLHASTVFFIAHTALKKFECIGLLTTERQDLEAGTPDHGISIIYYRKESSEECIVRQAIPPGLTMSVEAVLEQTPELLEAFMSGNPDCAGCSNVQDCPLGSYALKAVGL